jgi:hypothetical protein
MMYTKTGEACVTFARFCMEHKVGPSKVMEAITYCRNLHNAGSHGQKTKWRDRADTILTGLGFTDIRHYEEECTTFEGADGERHKLPFTERK